METLLETPFKAAASLMRGAHRSSRVAPGGFTLTELLAVVAIIAIMAALLVPGLAKAKQQSAAAACLNNQKQLAGAMHMYSEDNGDRIVQMADYDTGVEIYPAGGFWGGPDPSPGDWDDASRALEAVEIGLVSSNALYFYCSGLGLYHCPGDMRNTRIPSRKSPNGWGYDSYSRTQNLGGEPYLDYWGARATYTKMSAIQQPSLTFSMMEVADWRGYNIGAWAVMWSRDSFEWVSPPALSHLDAGSVGFADGHGVLHRWTDAALVAAGRQAAQGGTVPSWKGPIDAADFYFVYNGYLFPGHP
jgi:prepilin-type N-terminal cleavage/methylation domain-containing protein